MTVQTDGLTGIPYLDMDDYLAGKAAIVYFHNKMCDLYPSSYKLNINTLLLGLNSRGNKFFVDGLGLGIINNPEVSTSTVKSAMEKLAMKSGGRIPDSGSFTQAIANQRQEEFYFGDMASFVAITTAKQVVAETQKQAAAVGDVAASIGTGVSNVTGKVWNKTGDILTAGADTVESLLTTTRYIIPLILVGGVFLYVYLMPKRG